MPEGPEAKIIADALRTRLIDCALYDIYSDGSNHFHGLTTYDKVPRKVLDVCTYGKGIIFRLGPRQALGQALDKDLYLFISLRMTGKFMFEQSPYWHVRFEFINKHHEGLIDPKYFSLYYDDVRKMGKLYIFSADELHSHLSDYGPDLLQAAMEERCWITSAVWVSLFPLSSKRTIYSVLLDQRYVCGIGNYLASDILYYSRILPWREVSSLTLCEWGTLRVMAHGLIKYSYLCGGYTFNTFQNPTGGIGLYNKAVYGREDELDRNGYVIKSGPVRGGRTAFWVIEVQR